MFVLILILPGVPFPPTTKQLTAVISLFIVQGGLNITSSMKPCLIDPIVIIYMLYILL